MISFSRIMKMNNKLSHKFNPLWLFGAGALPLSSRGALLFESTIIVGAAPDRDGIYPPKPSLLCAENEYALNRAIVHKISTLKWYKCS
jgi:hypothetical protein